MTDSTARTIAQAAVDAICGLLLGASPRLLIAVDRNDPAAGRIAAYMASIAFATFGAETTIELRSTQ